VGRNIFGGDIISNFLEIQAFLKPVIDVSHTILRS
jgi:hypothetical protein